MGRDFLEKLFGEVMGHIKIELIWVFFGCQHDLNDVL
jgi:hypothetical protein